MATETGQSAYNQQTQQFNHALYEIGLNPVEAAANGQIPESGIVVHGMVKFGLRACSVNFDAYGPGNIEFHNPQLANTRDPGTVYMSVTDRVRHENLRCRSSDDNFPGYSYMTTGLHMPIDAGPDLELVRSQPEGIPASSRRLADGPLYQTTSREFSAIARSEEEAWAIGDLCARTAGLAIHELTVFKQAIGQILYEITNPAIKAH